MHRRVESGARPSRARCGRPAGCTQARSSESIPGGSIDSGGTLALKTTRIRAERQPAAQRQAYELGGVRVLLVPLLGLTDYELPAQSGRAIRDLFQRGARPCEVATAAVR